MCGIFGLIDYKRIITDNEKNKILRNLAIVSQIRGIDATGYASADGTNLDIFKRNGPAFKHKYYVVENAITAIGHCRLSTNRSNKLNINNHPFKGYLNGKFALIHNGVIINHKKLKSKLNLPKSKISTDSYVLVQLLEKSGKILDNDCIKKALKNVKGTVAIAIINEAGDLFLFKSGSPLYCIRVEQLGLYIFASRKFILRIALYKYLQKYKYKEIRISKDELVHIKCNGVIKRTAV